MSEHDPDELEPPPDPTLQARFRDLRGEDARRVPPFTNAPRRTQARRWVAPLALAAAGLLALVFVSTKRGAPEAIPKPLDPNLVPTTTYIAFEPAPLDFLLVTPQSTVLGQSPSFDFAPVQEPRP
ncbi:hypothetical protein BH09MYX1_BH09MYX1_48580 [soil metagenome]